MLVYCAMTGELNNYRELLTEYNLPKFNILFSFHYFKNLDAYLPFTDNILVDSGAFTYQQTGVTNLKKFVEEYVKFIKKYESNPKFNGFIELDIDNKIGYERVLNIRYELQEVTDKILPVWHKSLGVKEFKRMCEEYPYVCISGFANEDIKENQLIHFVRTAHKYNSKIHGLGLARPKILNYVPFDSCDASSYMRVSRYGNFKNKKVNSDFIRKNRKRFALLELTNHIKFQYNYHTKYKNIHNDKINRFQ